MPLKKTSFYLAGIGLLLGICLYYISTHQTPEAVYKTLPAVNPFEHSIAASGIVEAVNENIDIGVPVSALATHVYVHVWDRVKKGEPLFQLDDRDLQSQLAVQKANVAVEEARIVRLKDQLERMKAVKDPRAVSVEDLKTRTNDVAIAEALLAAAKAQLQNTETLIDRLTVRAPKDGMILQSNIRAGEYASADTTNPAMVLGDVNELQIRADVDEQNAYRVSPEAPAIAFPKNNPKLSIPLTFKRIEPFVIPKRNLTGLSEEKVDTRVLQVIYTFKQPENFRLYIGQQVDVFIKDGISASN